MYAPKRTIKLYTDGACSGNPGTGGWAAILYDNQNSCPQELSGSTLSTTNNRMELLAVIEGLRAIDSQPDNIQIFSDSQYVINGLQKGWAKSWRENGWRKSDGKPTLNTDLWSELLDCIERLSGTIEYHWIKGHANDPVNKRCDALAVAASRGAGRSASKQENPTDAKNEPLKTTSKQSKQYIITMRIAAPDEEAVSRLEGLFSRADGIQVLETLLRTPAAGSESSSDLTTLAQQVHALRLSSLVIERMCVTENREGECRL